MTKRHCCNSGFCLRFLFIFLVVSLVMLFIAICAALLFFSNERLPWSSAQGHQEAAASGSVVSLFTPFPVPLSPSGFDPLSVRSLNVTLDTSRSVQDARVHFYRTNHVNTKLVNLPTVTTFLAPILYVRDPLNYYQADIPLYTVGGNSSTIVYKVGAWSARTYSDCPLEIFLFDDETEYNRFKNGLSPSDSVGRYLQRSGCLHVGKENEKLVEQTVEFYLNEQSFYFVSVSIEKGVNVSCDMLGSVLEYDISDLKADDCSLSIDHPTCNLNISEGDVLAPGTIMSILACSNDLSTITYTVVTVLWNVWSEPFLCELMIPLLLLLTALAISLALGCQRSGYSNTTQYTKLSVQSKECQQ